MSGISLHIICDNCPTEQLNRAILYLKRTKQKRVQVAAGSQLDLGMQFVDRLHSEYPEIQVFWRNMAPEDTGILTKLSPVQLYTVKVKPYLDWFKRNKIVFMPDNETSGNDDQIRDYAIREAAVAGMLHADGLNGAFCRFATGNVQESQYILLKPIFNAMNEGDFVSPNEYYCQPGCSNGGHLNRYQHLWEAAGKKLPTAIGEYALAYNHDPGRGYRSVNMTSEYMAQLHIGHYQDWYEKEGVDVFSYCIGGYSWGSFQLDDIVLTALEKFAETQQSSAKPTLPQEPTPVPTKLEAMPKPVDARNARRVMVKFAAPLRNLRDGAGINYRDVGDVHSGDELMMYDPLATDVNGMKWAWVEGAAGNGWMALESVVMVNVVKETPTVETPQVPPEPAQQGETPQRYKMYMFVKEVLLSSSALKEMTDQGFVFEALA